MKKQDARHEGRMVLAWGEATGHCHEVVLADTGLPPDLAQAQFFEVDGVRELIVLAPCEITHQEHSRVTRTIVHPDGHAEAIDVRTGLVTAHPYPVPVRQGDVFLQPTAPGTWRHIQQREQYQPQQWRVVPD